MKRVLRIIVLGPLDLFMLVILTLVWPFWRGLRWLTEDAPWNDSLGNLWREAWEELSK